MVKRGLNGHGGISKTFLPHKNEDFCTKLQIQEQKLPSLRDFQKILSGVLCRDDNWNFKPEFSTHIPFWPGDWRINSSPIVC